MVETGACFVVYSIHSTVSFLGELIGTNYYYVPLVKPIVTLFLNFYRRSGKFKAGLRIKSHYYP